MMKASRFLRGFGILPIFLFFGVTFTFAQETTDSKPAETVRNVRVNPNVERYRIGLLDVIDVIVARHPELSLTNVKLDTEGRIRLPRIDVLVTAICKTENELALEIQEHYKKNYLRDPFITVNVREQNSQPFSVIGAVKKPGYFVTNRRLTLLELISFAGGPDVEFSGTKVQVARVGGISGCPVREDGSEVNEDGVTFFTYKLGDITSGRSNPVMRPGDIVYVEKADYVYVVGNVVKPQPIALSENLTLTQAIAASGGMLSATKKSQIRLIRQENGGKVETVYDLNAIRDKKIADPILQANDIIEVPTDKIKSFGEIFLKAITNGLPSVFYRVP